MGYTQPKFLGITYKYFINKGFLNDVDWQWTYDVLEWSINSSHKEHGIDSIEKVFARMDDNMPEAGCGLNYQASEEIILTHDHNNTNKYFKQIITKLLDKGIKFKSIINYL